MLLSSGDSKVLLCGQSTSWTNTCEEQDARRCGKWACLHSRLWVRPPQPTCLKRADRFRDLELPDPELRWFLRQQLPTVWFTSRPPVAICMRLGRVQVRSLAEKHCSAQCPVLPHSRTAITPKPSQLSDFLVCDASVSALKPYVVTFMVQVGPSADDCEPILGRVPLPTMPIAASCPPLFLARDTMSSVTQSVTRQNKSMPQHVLLILLLLYAFAMNELTAAQSCNLIGNSSQPRVARHGPAKNDNAVKFRQLVDRQAQAW